MKIVLVIAWMFAQDMPAETRITVPSMEYCKQLKEVLTNKAQVGVSMKCVELRDA